MAQIIDLLMKKKEHIQVPSTYDVSQYIGSDDSSVIRISDDFITSVSSDNSEKLSTPVISSDVYEKLFKKIMNNDYNNFEFTGNTYHDIINLKIIELSDANKELSSENLQLKNDNSILIDKLIKYQEEERVLTEAMQKHKCFVIPKLYIGMLISSAIALSISAVSLFQLALTRTYLINPYFSIALLLMGLGWGLSTLINIKKMGDFN